MIKALINKIKNQSPGQKKNSMLFLSIGAAVVLILFVIIGGSKDAKKIIVDLKNNAGGETEDTRKENVGILTGNVNTKSYVQRIEKQYHDLDAKTESTSDRLEKIEKSVIELRAAQAEIGKLMLGIPGRIEAGIDKKLAVIREKQEQNELVTNTEKEQQKEGAGDIFDQTIGYLKESTATVGSTELRRGMEIIKVGEITKTEKKKIGATMSIYRRVVLLRLCC